MMDKRYEIIIFWSSEDNVYLEEVPELPGCMADGKTDTEFDDFRVTIIGARSLQTFSIVFARFCLAAV